jgi:hypothetical protein
VKTVEGRATEDHVVCTVEWDYLEGYGLFVVIIVIAEGNLEGNGPEGLGLAARNHSIESDSIMAELGLGKAYFDRVSTYMMFRLLPPSIRHLENS